MTTLSFAVAYVIIATLSSAFSTSRRHHHFIHQPFERPAVLCETRYTIDDTVCPPSRPHLLQSAVEKACSSLDLFLSHKPIAAHTQQAFNSLIELVDVRSKPIILDSGCGTGKSTLLLAKKYPDHWVIGVDRSFNRLKKQQQRTQATATDGMLSSKRPLCEQVSDNAFLVRAELVDFWTCCFQTEWEADEHYLLYPNPYPTQTRLTQRWYAHPSFPLILQLGAKRITIRSNWEGYLKEFAKSVEIAHEHYKSRPTNFAQAYLVSAQRGPAERTNKSEAWTNFEQKYDAVGEPTFELLLQADI